MAEDLLDEALEMLDDTGPQYGPFRFVNHGPMAAEAILRLDRADAVVPWVRAYREHLEPAPAPGRPLAAGEWRDALGDASRFPDWEAEFGRQLAEAAWADVVGDWVTRLLPGFASDALHGVIRVAHATRALSLADTAPRRRELARGLALWASTYQTLPGGPPSAGGAKPSEALGRIRPISDDERGEAASIVLGLCALDDVADFAPVTGWVDAESDPAATLADLVDTAARVVHERAHDPLGAIIFIHGLTGPAALELLLPHLAPEVRGLAVGYAWQATAGLYAAFAGAHPRRPASDAGADDVVDRALATGDEHAIKFTEACLRPRAGSSLADVAAHAVAQFPVA